MSDLRNLPRYAALQLGLLLLRSLPPRALAGLLEGAGGLWCRLSPRRRRVAEENVRLALGEACPPEQRQSIARASFRNLGTVAAELLLAPRILAPRSAAARFHRDGDWDLLQEDLRAGRGALIVTGHLGNWEASNHALRHLGIGLRAVVRTLDDPLLDRLVTRLRGGEGVVIRKWGAAREIMRAIRQGDCVGLLGDQNAGKHGVFVPFFGLDACTFPLPGSLHARFDVPLYVGCALREGRGFRVPLRRLVAPADHSPEEREKWALRAIHKALEGWIRLYPKQYKLGPSALADTPAWRGAGGPRALLRPPMGTGSRLGALRWGPWNADGGS